MSFYNTNQQDENRAFVLLPDNAVHALRDRLCQIGGYTSLTPNDKDLIYEVLDSYSESEKASILAEESTRGVWSGGRDFEDKVDAIEEAANRPGYCYLRFILAIPEAIDMSVYMVRRMLTLFEVLGKEPYGNDVISKLTELKIMSTGGTMLDALRLDRGDQSRNVEELMDSRARYKLEENSGMIHIGTPDYDFCEHTGIHCEHGFRFKYYMTLLCQRDIKVGSTVLDFNNFFVEDDAISDDEQSTLHPLRVEAGFRVEQFVDEACGVKESSGSNHHAKGPVNRNAMRFANYETELRSSEADYSFTLEKESAKIRDLEQKLAERKNAAEAAETRSQVLRDELNKGFVGEPREYVESILPGDSSSELGLRDGVDRNKRRYMSPGTVLAVRASGSGKSRIENVVAHRLPTVPEVVIGYVKTEHLSAMEAKSHSKVRPINGLSKPFANQRLNFLAHLHTAFQNSMNKEASSGLTVLDKLRAITDRENRSPTMELLSQVIKVTFDTKELFVKANPFRLPYIEVGMTITDDCVYKCFDLLRSEYRMIWFDELKSLKVPKFSREFDSLSDETIKNVDRADVSSTHSKSTTGGSRSRRRSSSSSSTVSKSSRFSSLGF